MLGGGKVLCFHPKFQRVVFLRKFRIGTCEVLDPLLVVSFRFCEIGDFGGEVFDAGGKAVHYVGFLVGARHCGLDVEVLGWRGKSLLEWWCGGIWKMGGKMLGAQT